MAHEILRRRLQVNYSIFASLNNVRPELFGRLRESGLRSLFLGVETADPDLLWRATTRSTAVPIT